MYDCMHGMSMNRTKDKKDHQCFLEHFKQSGRFGEDGSSGCTIAFGNSQTPMWNKQNN